jgi:nicotinate-nucleotide pyrophosphorylase (carboxylating)
MAQMLDLTQVRLLWAAALLEDGADNDVTSAVAVDPDATGTAQLIAKEPGVFAGSVIVELAYEGELTTKMNVDDGRFVAKGEVLATIEGPIQHLLSIERTLLNFLQRLCGVASLTRRYVDAVAGTSAKIYDTRKTIPGWRQLDKYAVRCGGGCNHRMGLADAILIKDNHLAGKTPSQIVEDVSDMVSRAAALVTPPEFFECEVDTLEQLDALLKVDGVDVILVDNFTTDQLREAVARRDAAGRKGSVDLEASGGVNLDSVRQIAETGVDRISVGAITHSAPALDIGMEM